MISNTQRIIDGMNDPTLYAKRAREDRRLAALSAKRARIALIYSNVEDYTKREIGGM